MDGGPWLVLQFGGQVREGVIEKANRFHCQLSEEDFLRGFAASAGVSLFFIAHRILQAAAGKKTGEDGGVRDAPGRDHARGSPR